jgi:hypothetical protein
MRCHEEENKKKERRETKTKSLMRGANVFVISRPL